ncbi:MAG TPA: D-glucuronyl C5-epimerase family protein [Solirubrobacterales bacterium]
MAGYYVDFRVKARTRAWPPPELEPIDSRLFVAFAQWGLGAYEHFLHGGDEAWLRAALSAGEFLLARQSEGGEWTHTRPYPHTFDLQPPWVSAMAQGEGASLLTRLYRATGEERFADAALRALAPLAIDSADGGVRTLLNGRPFYEEYPTRPPSHVLNGAIFALWGLGDVAFALGDDGARRDFEVGVDSLAASIDSWDLGWWTRYDLFPHRVTNVASLAYHELHIDQLRAMMLVAPRPQLELALERFIGYRASRRCQARALAANIRFRLLIPRRKR